MKINVIVKNLLNVIKFLILICYICMKVTFFILILQPMNISILYIDDEPINIQLFEINFRKFYTVYSAISGKEALEIIQNTPIDFLISDYRMPEMDGMELIEEVKKIKPDIKCYLLSAYPETEIRNYLGNNNLLDGFIAKPWKKEEILKIIQEKAL